jgi:hypothetical protein
MSDSAPISGADKNDSIPCTNTKMYKTMMHKLTLTPSIRPFIRNELVGNVSARTLMTGTVNKPHAKNSRKMTINAW